MDEIRENANESLPSPQAGDSLSLTGDVVLTGDQIAAFCDRIQGTPQTFAVERLRTATMITRQQSLGQTEWRVTLGDNRGVVVVPIAGTE